MLIYICRVMPELRYFKRKRIRYLKFTPYDDSRCSVRNSVLIKAARLVFEDRLVACKYFGQKSRLSPADHSTVGCAVTTVEKTVLFSVVAVQIAKNTDFFIILMLVDHRQFQKVDLRMENRIWVVPSSVKIYPDQ